MAGLRQKSRSRRARALRTYLPNVLNELHGFEQTSVGKPSCRNARVFGNGGIAGRLWRYSHALCASDLYSSDFTSRSPIFCSLQVDFMVYRFTVLLHFDVFRCGFFSIRSGDLNAQFIISCSSTFRWTLCVFVNTIVAVEYIVSRCLSRKHDRWSCK